METTAGQGGLTGVPLGTDLDKAPRRHWRTWERDQAKLAADERVCDRFFILSAIRLGVKVGPDELKAFLDKVETIIGVSRVTCWSIEGTPSITLAQAAKIQAVCQAAGVRFDRTGRSAVRLSPVS